MLYRKHESGRGAHEHGVLARSPRHTFCNARFRYQLKNAQLAPSENRSTTSADGRVAKEAAWPNEKMEKTMERAKKNF